jgi:hypothetical protein
MSSAASLLPPPTRDLRGRAFAACVDASAALDPWQACPAMVASAPDAVLRALAVQNGVAGPLWHAMDTRAKKEALLASAQLLQRRRGSPWAVEEVMRVLGYTDALVLDRTRLLVYDGEIVHSGAHFFDSALGHWADYYIRLCMDEGSRGLMAADRAEAAALAAGWAPLRCALQGLHARHVLETAVDAPAAVAAMMDAVAFRGDPPGAAAATGAYWLTREQGGAVDGAETQAPGVDGAETQAPGVVVRWRLAPAALAPLTAVRRVALLDAWGRETEARAVPPVDVAGAGPAPCAVYEGAWTLKPNAGRPGTAPDKEAP